MQQYEKYAIDELRKWQREMQRKPSITGRITNRMQAKLNSMIPEAVHNAITVAIQHMISAVLKGAEFITAKPVKGLSLQESEQKVRGRIDRFKNTAAAEGAITGAGGLLLGLADFPLWLTLKMKMLSDIATLYGYDVRQYKERVYLLNIFQLAFSGRQHRRNVYVSMQQWDRQNISSGNEHLDWRKFQQEYRDYIDIAKLLQLIPGIGAVVGAYVNHKLTNKLGETAINAYRMRWFDNNKQLT